MRIILLGFGKVGQSLAEMLELRHDELRKNYGLNPQVVAIVDREGAAISEEGLNLSEALNAKKNGGSVSTLRGCGKPGLQALEVLEEVEGDITVEVTSTNLETGEPGLAHIQKALTLGMHVVTTNKGPLALSLPSLVELANRKDALLRFSGAVGSAIPVLDFAETCLYGDQVESIRGVLNGTTNYILWRMAESHLSLTDALKEAERLGYAERNVSYDLNGLDTASKLVIIAYHVMKRKASLKDVQVKGIGDITLKEILEAEKEGFAIRLIGSINEQITVSPRKIRIEEPLCVNSALNAVEFKCVYSGKHILIGPGAGAKETASSIVNDIIHVSK
ncbi:TPA: homoserine dehydrogenase, partial [Candidatus Bathyarchaeota archaeon]|nr:homoserine dehydrogenase [Candidatus Bathyarchaeota archaeon]